MEFNITMDLPKKRITISLIIISLFLTNAFSSSFLQISFAQQLSATLNLSEEIPFSADSRIAITGNNVYVVWTGSIYGNSNNPNIVSGIENDVFFTKSNNNGQTFTPPVALSGIIPGIQQEPKIAVSGNYVYVLWSDYSQGIANLFFMQSSNNGANFSEPLHLGTVYAAVGETQLVSEGKNVYVTWIGSADDLSAGTVLLKSSNDNGQTFGDTKRISFNGIASSPQLSGSNSNVYITWYNTTLKEDGTVVDNEILFRKSSDGGKSFSEPINLSNSPNTFSVRPQISVTSDGNKVYVVWMESGANAMIDVANTYFTTSHDGGKSFSEPINLSGNNVISQEISIPVVEVAGNETVYVVWSQYFPKYNTSGIENSANEQQNGENNMQSDMLFRKSSDGGKSFSEPINLSKNIGTSRDAKIINFDTNDSIQVPPSELVQQSNTNKKDVFLVLWMDDTGNADQSYDIMATTSHDGGKSFSEPINLSRTAGPSILPNLALSRLNQEVLVFLTWTESNAGAYNVMLMTALI